MIAWLVSATVALAQPCAGFLFPDAKNQTPTICSRIAKPPRSTYKVYPDGTSLPDAELVNLVAQGPTTRETMQRLDEYSKHIVPSKAQRLRVKDLAEKLRAQLVADVTGDTREEKISSAQRKLRERVANVKINLDSTRGRCADSLPNAHYNPDDNSINVCSSIMNLPVESLIGVLSHEYAHATDPCVGLGFTVDAAKAKQVVDSKSTSLKSCGATDSFIAKNYSFIQFALTETPGHVELSSSLAPLLMACGVVRGPATFLTRDEILEGPFRDVSREAGSRYPDKLQSFLNRLSQVSAATYSNTGVSPAPLVDPSGGFLTCSANAKETYADALGAQIASHYLQRKGPSLNQDRLKDLLFTRMYDVCYDGHSADHPPGAERMKTYLAHAEISRAMGCEFSGSGSAPGSASGASETHGAKAAPKSVK